MTFSSSKVLSPGKRKRQVCVFCTQSQLRSNESCRNGDQQNIRRTRRQDPAPAAPTCFTRLTSAKWSKSLMEAKKIKEEAAASLASKAMEQDGNSAIDGIERKLELMEGGGRTAVNGPLIPARRYSAVINRLAPLYSKFEDLFRANNPLIRSPFAAPSPQPRGCRRRSRRRPFRQRICLRATFAVIAGACSNPPRV